tara:strand:+ start:133 stop:246 length:114 start_codon:yes stop_codon:yes gene_type:complete
MEYEEVKKRGSEWTNYTRFVAIGFFTSPFFHGVYRFG